MDWRTENTRDLELLNLRSLAPLSAETVAEDGELAARIEDYNRRRARAVERLQALADDREHLADFNAWESAESAELADTRDRLQREAWDALLTLRCLLKERRTILELVEQRLGERYRCHSDDHASTLAMVSEQAKREFTKLRKSMPNLTTTYVTDLIASDLEVAEMAGRLDQARVDAQAATEARRQLVVDDGQVRRRQREVFAALRAARNPRTLDADGGSPGRGNRSFASFPSGFTPLRRNMIALGAHVPGWGQLRGRLGSRS